MHKKYTLEAQSLFKNFTQGKKEIAVLNDISFTFESGKSYAITGVSGSGKSTFLHLLGGLDTPSSGAIYSNTQNIAHYTTQEKESFLNHTIGFVFQFHYLIKELNVLDNIILKALIAGDTKTVATEKAEKLINLIGLSHRMYAYPTELSGGEQQRVSIARALITQPAFLLADEPTGNLDAENAHSVVQLFTSLQKDFGMGLIICTHDQSVYEKMETTLHLQQGKLIETTDHHA